MSVTLNGSGGLTFNDGSTQNTASLPGMRNRIINGAMGIDQRNAGASVTPNNSYTLDRWAGVNTQTSKFTVQQSSTSTAGFVNSLLVTSSSAYSVLTGDTFLIKQPIEGLNVSDLAWGTASASAVTLSFWVRSSLTGTFGGAVANSAASRSYVFTYTISSANTWEQKTVTIAGDTTGTWLTTNGVGIELRFGLGSGSTYNNSAGSWATGNYVQPSGSVSVVGTNGATFYITGVQLEKGSTATPFDYRPYGQELALCQRYYYSLGGTSAYEMFGTGVNITTTVAIIITPLPVSMRTAPSLTTSGNFVVKVGNTNTAVSGISLDTAGLQSVSVAATSTGMTVGNGNILFSNNSTATRFLLSSEL